MKNVTLIGPFIGDIESEISSFLPYVNFLKENIKNTDDIYLSVLNDRKFLYDKSFKFFDLEDHIFYEEFSQFQFINTLVTKKEYEELIKKFKLYVIENEGIQKKMIRHFSLPYSKNIGYHSIYEKIFRPPPVEHANLELEDTIILIPDIREDVFIYNNVIKELNRSGKKFKILGDKKIHFLNDNLFKNKDRNETYSYIISAIAGSRAVISRSNHWIMTANLFGKENFTWNNQISNFKKGSVYNFENDKSHSLIFDSLTGNSDILVKQLKSFLEGIV